MTRNIAVFNDLSGFGRCSLTASLPVYAALGIQCNPIPTVILTGQGGYTVKHRQLMTDMLPKFTHAWKENHAGFDAIATGYTADPKQLESILDFLDEFRNEDTFLLVDPVMGDHGRTYCSFSPELLKTMRRLVPLADLITPNLTEACLLLGEDFTKITSDCSKPTMLCTAETLALRLQSLAERPQDVVITGILTEDASLREVYNVAATTTGVHTYASPWFPQSFSGTGDLFSACMGGLRLNDYTTAEALPLTGRFLEHCIRDTIASGHAVSNEGVDFEQHLEELIRLKQPHDNSHR